MRLLSRSRALWICVLQRELRIALEDPTDEHWHLSLLPPPRTVPHAVRDRSAVGSVAALDRPGNADELGLQFIAVGADNCVAIADDVADRAVVHALRPVL